MGGHPAPLGARGTLHALPFRIRFFLSTFSYYYAVARLTLIVWHASDLSKDRNRVGLAILLGLELFCNFAETRLSGHRVYLIGHLSWGVAAYSALMIGWLLWDGRLSGRTGEETALKVKELTTKDRKRSRKSALGAARA